jgi:hypothetical protein
MFDYGSRSIQDTYSKNTQIISSLEVKNYHVAKAMDMQSGGGSILRLLFFDFVIIR